MSDKIVPLVIKDTNSVPHLWEVSVTHLTY